MLCLYYRLDVVAPYGTFKGMGRVEVAGDAKCPPTLSHRITPTFLLQLQLLVE